MTNDNMSNTDGGFSPFASSVLAGTMWAYAANVLYPIQTLKKLGIPISNQKIGRAPKTINNHGLGAHFSKKFHSPVMMKNRTMIRNIRGSRKIYLLTNAPPATSCSQSFRSQKK